MTIVQEAIPSDIPQAAECSASRVQAHRKRVENAMRLRIVDGTYQPGRLLPRLVPMAREFGVNTYTFRRAIQPLIDEGLLIVSKNPSLSDRPSHRLRVLDK
ncbi:GntR family transcriptional regulator [Streptomyces sp. NPDC056716]|uniref:GntR family transcriptional regulator n=1 Tax=unclassified Streptomyces TaxID=2593676 RepID=UPI0036840FAE